MSGADDPWLRVVVCGSREYREKAAVFRVLDAVHSRWPVALLGEGGCRRYDKNRVLRHVGADLYAALWCERKSVPLLTVFARWAEEGLAAGPLRNQRLIELARPHLLVQFPGGAGTRSMVRVARNAGFRLIEPAAAPAQFYLSAALPASFGQSDQE